MSNYSNVAAAAVLTSSPSNAAGSITVDTTTGFPSAPFTLALDYDTGLEELVSVTGVSGLTLTVTRGYDATTAVAHTAGAVVRHVFTAKDFRDSRTHEASTAAHGATGEVMGTTNAQVVINKDLSSGSNTFPSGLATLTTSQALTHKNLTDPSNTFPSSLATETEVAAAVEAHSSLTAAHGVTGAVVGTTDTQVLTNKDLTDASNTLPASVVTLTGSQTLTNKTLTSPTINGPVTGMWQTTMKGSDEHVTNTTTLHSDADLKFGVVAGGRYLFDIFLLVTTTAAADLNVCLDNPGGTMVISSLGYSTSASADTDPARLSANVVVVASGSGPVPCSPGPVGGVGVSTPMVVRYTGSLIATDAGVAQLKWAQSNATGADCTVKAGSWMRAERVF